ncbi:MAG: VIT1/CCC1 transporter family protein [Thermosulfidibacteraceae bacterium]|jgi:VIT1/CCC1 family predicted Fe2+/Mn2+ transporter
MGEAKSIIEDFQRNEITEYHIYKFLARRSKSRNKELLEKIAEDEFKHYLIWRKITGVDVKPDKKRIFLYVLLSILFGLTFAIKLMERGEEEAEKAYREVARTYPIAGDILKDEFNHENMLVSLIEEKRLKYLGSIVLGLNDALVELTGSLAGFTFAMQNSKVIGLAGLIMGIAASLSMCASEYLSQKSEGGDRSPFGASFYTGVAYILTVAALVWPFFVFSWHVLAFFVSLVCALGVIYVFTFFISVIKESDFKRNFAEMLFISFGVAFVSFVVGSVARKVLGIGI